MTEPKLLTEAEALELYLNLPRADYLSALRERGLIAEGPVDPLREAVIAANAEAMRKLHFTDTDAEPKWLAVFVDALRDRGVTVAERKELTLETVREATGLALTREEGAFDDALHAALVERLK